MPRQIYARSESLANQPSYLLDLTGDSTLQKGNEIIAKIFKDHPELQDRKEIMLQQWREHLDNTRVLVFDDGEVDDFRRLIVFRHNMVNSFFDDEKLDFFIGIKQNGKIESGYVSDDGQDYESLHSTGPVKEFDQDGHRRYLHRHPLKFARFYFSVQRYDYHREGSIILLNMLFSDLPQTASQLNKNLIHQAKLSMIQEYFDKIVQIYELLLDSMDKDAADLIDICQMYKMKEVKWLVGWNDKISSDIFKIRRQAARTYPLLVKDIYENKAISRAIDSKESLLSAISEEFGVDQNRIKRVNGLTLQDIGEKKNNSYTYKRIVTIFHMSERNFHQLKPRLSDLNIIDGYGLYIQPKNPLTFLEWVGKNGNLSKTIEQMKAHNPMDIGDSLDFLNRKLLLPLRLNAMKNHAEKHGLIWDHKNKINQLKSMNKKFIFDEFNMKHIFKLSERFHRNIARYEDILNDVNAHMKIEWNPMIGHVDLNDDYIARELHSASMLKKQGRHEEHCIGGYTNLVLNGLNSNNRLKLIFSLEKDGKIEATLDIHCHHDRDKKKIVAKIMQIRGKNNSDISQESRDYAKILLKRIEESSLSQFDDYLKNINRIRREYMENEESDLFYSYCGFNPFNRDFLNLAWEELKPSLPSRLRRAGLDGCIDLMEINDDEFHRDQNDDEVNIWEKTKAHEKRLKEARFQENENLIEII